jgi:hypothetical protein
MPSYAFVEVFSAKKNTQAALAAPSFFTKIYDDERAAL